MIQLDNPILRTIGKISDAMQLETYVVGGYVRDTLLKKEIPAFAGMTVGKDIDIVTVGSGIELAKKVAEELKVKDVQYFKNFGTAMLMYEGSQIEFVGARKESYRSDSRKPIVEDGTLQDDLNRRDFTINALAVSLNQKNYEELIDVFKGQEDLKNKIIRTPLNPDITFSDDPLRMFRAIRFASQLNFEIEKKTFDAITKNAKRIEIVSMERITDELNKIILSPVPSMGFLMLFRTGLLQIIFPEMTRLAGVEKINGMAHKDNFLHTLKVLDNVSHASGDLWLRWSAVLHDIAKPLTKRFDAQGGWTFHGHEDKGARMVPKIFARMKLPLNEKMRFVQKMVQLHLRPIALVDEIVTDSACRRLLFDAGEDLESLMKLCRADITTRNREKMEMYLENFSRVEKKLQEVEARDRIRNWQPPIDGTAIMKIFNLNPCREVGLIKDKIKNAILDGETPNTYQDAYALMVKFAREKLKLSPKE